MSMTESFCLYIVQLSHPSTSHPQLYPYYFLRDEWSLIGDSFTVVVSLFFLFQKYHMTDSYYP